MGSWHRRLRPIVVALVVGGALVGGMQSSSAARDPGNETSPTPQKVGKDVRLNGVSFAKKEVDARAERVGNTIKLDVSGTLFQDSGFCGTVWLQREGATGALASRLVPMEFWRQSSKPGSQSIDMNFEVPAYGPTAETRWRITSVQIGATRLNDKCTTTTTYSGDRLSGPAFQTAYTAQNRVDAEAPQVDSITYDEVWSSKDPVRTGGWVWYDLVISDVGMGFWAGSATLRGPEGRTASAAFSALLDGPDEPRREWCPQRGDHGQRVCRLMFRLPYDAPAGTWTLDAIELTDNADNTKVHRDLGMPPLEFGGRTLWMSNFRVDRAVVDNSTTDQTVVLSGDLRSTKGVSSVHITGTDCHAGTPVLPPGGNGTFTVPIVVPVGVEECPYNVWVQESDYLETPFQGDDLPTIRGVKVDPAMAAARPLAGTPASAAPAPTTLDRAIGAAFAEATPRPRSTG